MAVFGCVFRLRLARSSIIPDVLGSLFPGRASGPRPPITARRASMLAVGLYDKRELARRMVDTTVRIARWSDLQCPRRGCATLDARNCHAVRLVSARA